MADKGTGDTFEKTLAGKVITFKRMQATQLMMLQRYVEQLETQMKAAAAAQDSAAVGELMRTITNTVFAAVESLFVNPDDINHVQIGIITGTVSDNDLYSILGGDAPGAADDEDPAPIKRAPRAAAKKPVKATSSRAKR